MQSPTVACNVIWFNAILAQEVSLNTIDTTTVVITKIAVIGSTSVVSITIVWSVISIIVVVLTLKTTTRILQSSP